MSEQNTAQCWEEIDGQKVDIDCPEGVLATVGVTSAPEVPVDAWQCWEEVDGELVAADCPDGWLASSETASHRLSLCKSCPSYKSAVFVCGECLCIMPAKTKLGNSACPLGKW